MYLNYDKLKCVHTVYMYSSPLNLLLMIQQMLVVFIAFHTYTLHILYKVLQVSVMFGGPLRTRRELFLFHFREILFRFREILSRFREIISRFREILSRFREII